MSVEKAGNEKNLHSLRQEYLRLVNIELPNAAKTNNMPIRLNHCFGRVLLDHVFQDCWYEHLRSGTAAYKQLDEEQLAFAINMAKEILVDPALCHQLNHESLVWRGKR